MAQIIGLRSSMKSMKSIKLKNCPFCGSDKISYVLSNYFTPSLCYVQCKNCFVSTNPVEQKEAAKIWNRRIRGKERLS